MLVKVNRKTESQHSTEHTGETNHTRHSNAKFQSVISKALDWLITGIIFAVVATILSSIIMTKHERRVIAKQQLSDISNIYIGSNREWLNEHFGVPQFVGYYDKFTFCAYILDYFAIQVAFDEADAAQAYLITALETDSGTSSNKWAIKDATFNSTAHLILGDFSYYDFPSKPESVFGWISNGTARALYTEMYYFMSSGNYYEYYIASLDFGKLDGSIEDFLAEFGMPQGDIDDEVDSNRNLGIQVIVDRKKSKPNTYGVSTQESVNIMQMLLSYDWFNSKQLRNKLNIKE